MVTYFFKLYSVYLLKAQNISNVLGNYIIMLPLIIPNLKQLKNHMN